MADEQAAPRALVTGAARGIGFAIAHRLIERGARVVVNDLEPHAVAAAVERLGPRAVGFAADVSAEPAVDDLLRATVSQLGGLDWVVNNAGVSAPLARSTEQTLDSWQRTVDVNLRGTFLVCRASGRYLVAQSRGSIVNIGSAAGLAALPASNAYGVSKAAVAMLTKTLAAEWGRYGVRVNCVAPGFIETAMLDELMSAPASDSDAARRRIPLRRFGTVAEIAAVVAFLLSDAASYVCGAVVPVDGGWLSNAGG